MHLSFAGVFFASIIIYMGISLKLDQMVFYLQVTEGKTLYHQLLILAAPSLSNTRYKRFVAIRRLRWATFLGALILFFPCKSSKQHHFSNHLVLILQFVHGQLYGSISAACEIGCTFLFFFFFLSHYFEFKDLYLLLEFRETTPNKENTPLLYSINKQ